MFTGATPVFVELKAEDQFRLKPDQLLAAVTDKTKAILPVHLYGQCADIEKIEAIAKKHNLKVIADGAQAIGSKHKGKGIGAYGDASTLSFFPTKNLGACGDGGMVLASSKDVDFMSRSLRFHGMDGGYTYEHVGYCTRLDEIQAAILRVKLKKIVEWNEARRTNAAHYLETLADLPIKLPVSKPENYHIYHQFTLRFDKRDELKAKLAERGVGSAVYYPSPLHLQNAYADLGYKEGDFPEAEKAARQVLSLPVFPELSREDVEKVAIAVKESVQELI
jgi:dTDP-4-amino-4,6-dideoxygalactose transaminase